MNIVLLSWISHREAGSMVRTTYRQQRRGSGEVWQMPP